MRLRRWLCRLIFVAGSVGCGGPTPSGSGASEPPPRPQASETPAAARSATPPPPSDVSVAPRVALPLGASAVGPALPATRLLPTPPWEAAPAASSPQPPRARLRVRSQRRNQITDTDAWLHRIGRTSPWETRDSLLARGVQPERIGEFSLIRGITHPDHTVLFYGVSFSGGPLVVLLDAAGVATDVLDFSAYAQAPGTVAGGFVDMWPTYAQRVDRVLYISHGHQTYANGSGGMNAYVTAVDLDRGRVLWRSAPLVSNAMNFVVRDDVIVCGYGFTSEPDFMDLIDRLSGRTLTRLALASGPEIIFANGGVLDVRTYHTDYVLELDVR